jgi:pimeloyl-ACP methyl ester carboxylesterase
MSSLFRAYVVENTKVPTYFIASTAPDNVDGAPPAPVDIPQLKPIQPDAAIAAIASELSDAADPNLVVMVHGFNNPQQAALAMYARASATIESDDKITSRKGLVCVGYHWPSEAMFTPWSGTFSALPSLAILLSALSLSAVAAYLILGFIYGFAANWAAEHVLLALGLFLAGLVGFAVLLRVIVYFRDGYRATNYGAPDLIEIIRHIDRKIIESDAARLGDADTAADDVAKREDLAKARRDGNRVQLSFIGHSMGGYVVTNAIRVLTDLFDERRPTLDSGVINPANEMSAASAGSSDASPKLGDAFTMMRLILASPDIPAETLLSNRANFLAASLRRFREAYLFSSEGDEVLRQVSTLANYFSFPAISWKFGFRLGNAETLSSDYGVVKVEPGAIATTVRVGYDTLRQMYAALRRLRGEGDGYQTLQDKLAERFSYFDCTDYVEPDAAGREVGLLTFALKLKLRNPAARMSFFSHMHLLLAYAIWQKPDVHAGYFQGALSQQLMYRFACLGYGDAVKAYEGMTALSDACRKKQIRVVFSSGLDPGV